jgi:hypothetical protein
LEEDEDDDDFVWSLGACSIALFPF